MPTSSENCPSCFKPKQAQSSGGFVTQFVDVCCCGRVDNLDTEPVEVAFSCKACSKLINSRPAGSMTQWIFRPDFCQCAVPVPVERSSSATGFDKHAFVLTEDDGEELELNPESFPLERYQPKARLGSGASGSVYLSRDRLLGKLVAVKLLHELNAAQLMAFQEEARITSRLHHPSIIQVLDFGPTESGIPYMVLEYIDRAAPLEKFLESNGTIDGETWFKIFYKVADALSHAHDSGIFHRDLKPSNILLSGNESGDPVVKLIDFGVAKLKLDSQEPTIVQGRTIAGTPAYMPPELAQGEGFDSRSEIYSLGCVMFESLTGRPPFHGETALEIIAKHTNEPVPRISEVVDRDYPPGVEYIVSRCLEKNRENRFASVTELRNEIDRAYVTMSRTEQSKVGVASGSNVEILEDVRELLASPSTAPIARTSVASSAPGPRNTDSKFAIVMSISILCCIGIVLVMMRGPKTSKVNSAVLAGPKNLVDPSGFPSRPDAFDITPRLKRWVAAIPIEDGDLISLVKMKPQIDILDLSKGGLDAQIDISDKGWAAVAKLPLKELSLTRVTIHDSGIKLISKAPNLVDLDLTDTNVTDKGIAALQQTPLTKLSLAQCVFLTDRSASIIAKMQHLERLTISGTEFTDKGLRDIVSSLKLEQLKINGCNKLSAEGLKSVALCKTIKILQIGNNRMNADVIRGLKDLPLSDLDIAGCKGFDNHCLELVAQQWPNMSALRIDQTGVNGKGLAPLLAMQNLNYLDVSLLKLTDKAVIPLAQMRALTNMNLSDNDITDSALLAFKDSPQLRRISANKCTRITKTAVRTLERAGKKVDHFSWAKAQELNKDLIENLGLPSYR